MKKDSRFKLPPREIRLICIYAKREKVSETKFLEEAIKEFLTSL